MIKPSLSPASPRVAPYTGNEALIVSSAVLYGHTTYVWDARYVSFLDAFLLGLPLEATTTNVIDPLTRFVAFANGTLLTTDLSYAMISQYNDYLATLKLGE